MTRTPKEAEQGNLNLILGGDEADIDEVMELLRCFADTITRAGPVGAGHGLKLIHNYVSLGYTAILAEAVAAARTEAIDTETMISARGWWRQVRCSGQSPPLLQDGDDSGLRFSLANAAKDISYFTIANRPSRVASACTPCFGIQPQRLVVQKLF